jgi:hypothetical protein
LLSQRSLVCSQSVWGQRRGGKILTAAHHNGACFVNRSTACVPSLLVTPISARSSSGELCVGRLWRESFRRCASCARLIIFNQTVSLLIHVVRTVQVHAIGQSPAQPCRPCAKWLIPSEQLRVIFSSGAWPRRSRIKQQFLFTFRHVESPGAIPRCPFKPLLPEWQDSAESRKTMLLHEGHKLRRCSEPASPPKKRDTCSLHLDAHQRLS